jgi:hypothetical protein
MAARARLEPTRLAAAVWPNTELSGKAVTTLFCCLFAGRVAVISITVLPTTD